MPYECEKLLSFTAVIPQKPGWLKPCLTGLVFVCAIECE
ncbi:hypothetical protein CLOBOL_01798 [Enterocloster bolteae ATCC BAA-613]|uniref:Uncharacterized protein n=1 Tax=Enterocloster bolteae (strain ATCC BAA-613 / DSM 15670 / CCUG 46953 / JCM 12243 / WAL 16351) TaxID=411902 RepID=A8RM15_ENTBW|nr:hypothetical protein CLOBOL_01798 [Enterocloster bolteae ATCC BAA-613]